MRGAVESLELLVNFVILPNHFAITLLSEIGNSIISTDRSVFLSSLRIEYAFEPFGDYRPWDPFPLLNLWLGLVSVVPRSRIEFFDGLTVDRNALMTKVQLRLWYWLRNYFVLRTIFPQEIRATEHGCVSLSWSKML